ncbi:unnamed protein product [Prorocentrum cordatum]|uniref:Uncharacterized protein n=1 Tax=Prorocentrum cordatum TaxID=2364126 RepID=A0ABN9RKQ2_9DINO|nr:unnamed protein product [Polarella glacialis]
MGKSLRRYEEVDVQTTEVPRGFAGSIPPSFFTCKPRNCSLPNASRIVSGQQAPPWPSPSPMGWLSLVADLEVYRHANATNRWNGIETSWLSILLWCDRNSLVCRTGEGDQMYFPTAALGGVCGIGWPAENINVAGYVFYRPKLGIAMSDLKWLHIWDVDDWGALALQWIGPLRVKCLTGVSHSTGPVCAQAGGKQGLWQVAARNAFWTLPKTPMLQLALHRKVGVLPTATLFDIVKACVQNACPALSAQELADIMQKRRASHSVYDEFLAEEGAVDLLEDSERKGAKQVVDDAAKHASSKADFTNEYVSWKKRFCRRQNPRQRQRLPLKRSWRTPRPRSSEGKFSLRSSLWPQ